MLKALNKMADVFGRGHATNNNLVFIVELSISLASLANEVADIGAIAVCK